MPEAQPAYELVRERLKKTRAQKKKSLRDVAAEIGVSAATLSRFERGAGTPDLPTLNRLIDWLELDRKAVYAKRSSTPASSIPNQVAVLLRADKNLDSATAKALANIFKTAYKELSEE